MHYLRSIIIAYLFNLIKSDESKKYFIDVFLHVSHLVCLYYSN